MGQTALVKKEGKGLDSIETILAASYFKGVCRRCSQMLYLSHKNLSPSLFFKYFGQELRIEEIIGK